MWGIKDSFFRELVTLSTMVPVPSLASCRPWGNNIKEKKNEDSLYFVEQRSSRLIQEGLLCRHKKCEMKCRKTVAATRPPARAVAGSTVIKLSQQIIY